jgi:adenylate cyclase
MSFFEELRRRNVFRVGVAYIIVAWLLLQVGDTLGPALHLPEWFQSGVAFVVILGFPIAMIFAWAFEMTPEGVKHERDVDRTQSITQETGQKLNFTIIGLLVVAVAYLALDKFVLEHDHEVVETHAAEPSIAVLPFTNMSDDASNEFFADGITEELLNLLAKIPELEVTSRTSAFQFKGKDVDIPTVAKQLNVDHVLEGSVRKAGMKVRITAQLIDAETDKHIWSETYDRELDDIFAIQDEIARKVVDELHVTLLGEAPTVRETDADAYALYLEGRHYLDLDAPGTWSKAQALFEQVLEIDADYAPAWFGKSRAIREQANWGSIDLAEGTEKAREWAEHAVSIDPTLAEAWAYLAHLKSGYDWDWEAARELADRALAEGPNNPAALAIVGEIEQTLGRLELGLEYKLRALRLDPLSHLRIREAGWSNVWLRRWDEAEKYFLKSLELYPDDTWPGNLVAVRIFQGRHQEAADMTDAITESNYPDPVFAMNFVGGYSYYGAGRLKDAEAATNRVVEDSGAPVSYQLAEMYATQGNIDKAFDWLETGYDYRDGGLTYLLGSPFLISLHDDPRWRPFLEKMNLLVYWDAMPGR